MRVIRSVLALTTAAILAMALITGCAVHGSTLARAQELIHQYPWLASIGMPLLQWLIVHFGSDIADLLSAAMIALAG